MRKIPGISLSFNLDTVTLFTCSSSKGYHRMAIITIFLLSNISNYIIYKLFFAALTYSIHRWQTYKFHALLTAKSSPSQNLSLKTFTYKTNETPEYKELHILKDLLQIAVIVTPLEMKCDTVIYKTTALVGWHRSHFPSSLERQNPKNNHLWHIWNKFHRAPLANKR